MKASVMDSGEMREEKRRKKQRWKEGKKERRKEGGEIRRWEINGRRGGGEMEGENVRV